MPVVSYLLFTYSVQSGLAAARLVCDRLAHAGPLHVQAAIQFGWDSWRHRCGGPADAASDAERPTPAVTLLISSPRPHHSHFRRLSEMRASEARWTSPDHATPPCWREAEHPIVQQGEMCEAYQKVQSARMGRRSRTRGSDDPWLGSAKLLTQVNAEVPFGHSAASLHPRTFLVCLLGASLCQREMQPCKPRRGYVLAENYRLVHEVVVREFAGCM
jgi:hypothetical protein